MKKRLLFSISVIMLLASVSLIAQVPRTFSYQGHVTNGSGTPISDGAHTVTVNLYNAPSGGSPIYTETQNVGVSSGVFSMIIGSVTPIPPSVSFDGQYYLSVSVDGGAEMTPRTALTSVPSAMNAGVAEQAKSLAPGATGVVTSLNGRSGALTLQGGGGTTVTQSGNTVTISSSGGGSGSGIQGVQNSDGTMAIQNPNGPVATISVANGGITPSKLSAAGSSAGQVLVSNGSTVQWDAPPSGLTLPYVGAVANPQTGIEVTTNGKGSAIYGISTSLGTPIAGYSTGDGRAGSFVIANTRNSSEAIFAWTDGTGKAIEGYSTGNANAGFFHVDYPAGAKDALVAETNTAGAAFKAHQKGNGTAGNFLIDLAPNNSSALYARTNGTGKAIEGFCASCSAAVYGVSTNGYGVWGGSTNSVGVRGHSAGSEAGVEAYNNNNGPGLSAFSSSGYGLYSKSNGSSAGRFENTSVSNSHSTVYVTTNNGREAVLGQSTGTSHAGAFEIQNSSNTKAALAGRTDGSGAAVLAEFNGTNTGTALELNNGYIKVSGENKTAFIHTTSTTNTSSGSHITRLSYPGASNTDILFVTHHFGKYIPAGTSYSVYWSGGWNIYLDDVSKDMPIGTKFNVLVIKQ